MLSISFILESSLLFAKHFVIRNHFLLEHLRRILCHLLFPFLKPFQDGVYLFKQWKYEFVNFHDYICWNISKFHFDKKTKKNQTIWCLLRLSRIWKILINLFNSLLSCKLIQNISINLEKSSKIGQDKKSLISTFPCFLTVVAKI